MFQTQNRETINSTWDVAVSFKIIMTTSVTRSCFSTQHKTCKTNTKTKTDGLRPHHWAVMYYLNATADEICCHSNWNGTRIGTEHMMKLTCWERWKLQTWSSLWLYAVEIPTFVTLCNTESVYDIHTDPTCSQCSRLRILRFFRTMPAAILWNDCDGATEILLLLLLLLLILLISLLKMKTLEWPLAQVVCRLKTVVEQDSVESLSDNRRPLTRNAECFSHIVFVLVPLSLHLLCGPPP